MRYFLNMMGVALWGLVSALLGYGQEDHGALVLQDTIATFMDAEAVAIDPFGLIYVVDAGHSRVTQINLAPQKTVHWGGFGRSLGTFDDPQDIDVTNGLLYWVVDAGNGRLQQFGDDFQVLEALVLAEAAAGLYRASERYYPVAVQVSRENDLFVLEESRGVILKFDANRRLQRVIGGEGAGRLRLPVAVVLGEQALFVADSGAGSIAVFDLFGGFLQHLGAGNLAGLRTLAIQGEWIWGFSDRRVWVYAMRGRLERVYTLPAPRDVRDAALYKGQLFLLTPNQLLRYQLP